MARVFALRHGKLPSGFAVTGKMCSDLRRFSSNGLVGNQKSIISRTVAANHTNCGLLLGLST
jgi:hypothetical protein